jgi:hypothetical protein
VTCSQLDESCERIESAFCDKGGCEALSTAAVLNTCMKPPMSLNIKEQRDAFENFPCPRWQQTSSPNSILRSSSFLHIAVFEVCNFLSWAVSYCK